MVPFTSNVVPTFAALASVLTLLEPSFPFPSLPQGSFDVLLDKDVSSGVLLVQTGSLMHKLTYTAKVQVRKRWGCWRKELPFEDKGM